MFEEYGHILSIDRPGHDLIGDAILVEVVEPELYRVGGVRPEVEVFPDIA